MALTLEVMSTRYRWLLREGEDRVTVQGLKDDHIGERCRGDVLYHQKLRFSSESKALKDEDQVPLSPSVVQVSGPHSVVQMLHLFCARDGKPLPRPEAVSQPVRQPQARSAPQVPMLTYAPAPIEDVQEAELRKALLASQKAFEDEEERELRWALEESARLARQEESARLAEEEEIRKFYMADMQNKHKSKASSSSSTTARAEAQLVESEEEGVAWDSNSEDSDDDGPPPLELLPDSEE
ncbi:unnamed protein product [Effrenium voratum]|nr:unnamed protein product [Effrenium voratum]